MFLGILFMFVVCTFKCCNAKPVEDSTEIKSDTVFIHSVDTFYIKKDSIRYKYKTRLDTIYIHDTILIREQKKYEDSISTIWISGIEPEIDSIHYYLPKDTFIVNTEITHTIYKENNNGWGITLGAYAGYGANAEPSNGIVKLAPSIGLSVTVGYTWLFKKPNKAKNSHSGSLKDKRQ